MLVKIADFHGDRSGQLPLPGERGESGDQCGRAAANALASGHSADNVSSRGHLREYCPDGGFLYSYAFESIAIYVAAFYRNFKFFKFVFIIKSI